MCQFSASHQYSGYHPDDLIFIQSRATINAAVIEEYAEMMVDGIVFDPVEAVQTHDGKIYVFDGFHRGEAARKAGIPLRVNLRPGTQIDAEWLALGANQKHGLRRTKADVEQIARNALLKFPNRSIREIYRHTGINRRQISRIRSELIASGAIAPDNTITVTRGGVTYRQDTTNIGSQIVCPTENPNSKVVERADLNQNNVPVIVVAPNQFVELEA